MMKRTANQHLYPIINLLLEDTLDEVQKNGKNISCKAGCNYCCHLLVEVTWEEAQELAYAITKQPAAKRKKLLARVKENAAAARELFNRTKRSRRFMKPATGRAEIPDQMFDDYFYKEKRPCPFLDSKKGICSVYEYRPSACRFHVVTTPAENCSADLSKRGVRVHVPQAVEDLKEELDTPIHGVNKDPRWGHMAIMVEAVLAEETNLV